ncbi:class I SAM-dependent methyltransferase [Novosphingobium flavum]|uniref:Class I SAM-dependent methyltransferase n=1 Tax=Novosphingobium flavum TaxID=1778672 RepID=A0A7X1KME3_9SPHN|nr:class I SAM-dependent methyltransferase [Novosphingobium flavum]MBC2666225.1 class I SAM-dependent methyltransferase [Novosphingobium flavum]
MRMFRYFSAAAVSLALVSPALAKPAPFMTAAVADAGRPAEDKARDEARKPLDMLEFAGFRPGMKVGELLPGAGYFTRIFAKAVGAKGKVYAYLPAAAPARATERMAPLLAAYKNVEMVKYDTLTAPAPLDLVWTSQNYHDLHGRGGSPAKLNAEIFAALKPGGIYIVEDHRAASGTWLADVERLHRIDEAAVIVEVQKAGFVLDDESLALRRTDDDHTKNPRDIHDNSDQFVLKFRKPK